MDDHVLKKLPQYVNASPVLLMQKCLPQRPHEVSAVHD